MVEPLTVWDGNPSTYEEVYIRNIRVFFESRISIFILVVFSPTAIALESSAIAELFSDSLLLWGRSGPWAALVGSAEGSTKGFHQGSTKVLQVLWCLWFSGQIFFSGLPKSFRRKVVLPRFHTGGCFYQENHICLSNGCCCRKGSLERCRQLFSYNFLSQSRSGVKVAWVVDISHIIH